ncbi:polymorphic toxin-type HINT domain-containing protein, partial [Paenibacillus hemerocallicola]|uniref:polymorphic toxin-type HINT domain-containing protein n=1 Tax=Paenibacillus hemerocallicola TaxID=1172614 RepID=UPI001FEBC74D
QGDSLILSEASYSYSPWNELTQATSGSETTTFQYSPETEGLRIKKTSPTGTLRYTYNGNGQVIAESDANNNVIAQYVWGPDRLLMKKEVATGQSYYYMQNGHGDVVQMVNTSGAVVNSYRYDEWGNILSQSEGVPNAFKYAGEMYDTETGFYYLRARYYDPSVGRFINKDTYEGDISNPLSLNLYTYVGNNPLRFIDPSGHDPREVQLMLEMARDGELGMSDVKDRLGSYYQRIFQDDDNNYFNYLFGMATMTSAYENSLGNSQWAIGVLVEVNTADLVSAHELATLLESMVDVSAALTAGAKAARVRASSNLSVECNCFTAGTKVLTDEGEKNIEDIEVGDKVLSKDEETGEVAYKEVTATFNHETDEIYNIHVGGQAIESTFNHPFYVKDKGWTFVKDLQVGDLLVQSDGNTLMIDSIELEHKQVTVYNMTVDEFHTYFVSDLEIWVHNTNCSWNTVVESKNATRTIDGLAKEQREALDKAVQGLASGNTSGLNVHRLSDGRWAADVKGIGKGRGQGRIIYTEKDGVITIDEVTTKHYSK